VTLERRIDGELEARRRSVGGGGVPGSGVGEMVKGRGERVEGVLVVPMRARDRALGLCLGRATAMARWRALGAAWHGFMASSSRGRGRWKLGRDTWRSLASRRWLPGRSTAAGGSAAVCRLRGAE